MSNRYGLPWTPEEDECLRQLAAKGLSDRSIAEALGRSSITTLQRRRTALGIHRRAERTWTPERLAKLKQCEGLSNRKAAQRIGVDTMTVHNKRRELGLSTCVYRRWTQEELQLLYEHYPTKGSRYVAEHTGWSRNAITAKAHQLGLRFTSLINQKTP